MATKNAVLEQTEEIDETDFDFDEFVKKLESQLEAERSDLEFLVKDKEMISNPDHLGNTVMNVVWEQFVNQIGTVAGEDFIKENRGHRLDLRNEAHIQTTEKFAEGKIATHNTEINYQERYDDWQSSFKKDENGKVITHTTRSGKEVATLEKGARKPFDENRPKGSAEKGTAMDHTVAAAEIIRDPAANAHMTKEEQIAFANSDKNLNEMDSSLNTSKGDLPMDEWLDNPNSKGQKPKEIFDISDEEEKRLRQKDAEAREEYEKQKKEGEERSIKAGKKSQREEAFRIGGKALRAAIMGLLADLVKDIFQKLILWFKSSQKNLDTFIEQLKAAIHTFVGNLKQNLMTAANTVGTTIATAILGPIVGTIKKIGMILKQGATSVKEAIEYIKNPENKGKPFGILMLEVGKIVIAGLTGIGAMVLGETIEKGLMTIPIFAFEIPLIGSLANIMGIFLGAVVSGIIGAIVINLIDRAIAKSQISETISKQIKTGNEVIQKQEKLLVLKETQLQMQKETTLTSIGERHADFKEYTTDAAKTFVDASKEDYDGNVDIFEGTLARAMKLLNDNISD